MKKSWRGSQYRKEKETREGKEGKERGRDKEENVLPKRYRSRERERDMEKVNALPFIVLYEVREMFMPVSVLYLHEIVSLCI